MSPTQATFAVLMLATATLNAASADQQRRLTPEEIEHLATSAGGAGTSDLPAVATTVLYGDPKHAGLYTIRLRVAPNTVIPAHTHRDARTATVVAGTWYFGYGRKNVPGAVRKLPAGSFYTEPANDPHFARTGADGAVVVITGVGPTDTRFVNP